MALCVEFGSLWRFYSSWSVPVDLSVCRAFAGPAIVIRRIIITRRRRTNLVSEKHWKNVWPQ